MKRSIIAAIIFILGFLLCAGGVGTIEFEMSAGISEIVGQTIKSAFGMVLMGVALSIGGLKRSADE